MLAKITINEKNYELDLAKPIDLSIPIMADKENVNAFYLGPVTYIPFSMGTFIGDVSKGGACNVNTITINPHGNGTHTETVGHISKNNYPIRTALMRTFFTSRLITLDPEKIGGDFVITLNQLKEIDLVNIEALIIRTLPNSIEKKIRQYSGTNPAYMAKEAADFLRLNNIQHVLLDLPSIDREEDGGKLSAHHAFWNYPESPRTECTITELMYVEDKISDGFYLLDLQFAAFDNDASPSRPIIYALKAI